MLVKSVFAVLVQRKESKKLLVIIIWNQVLIALQTCRTKYDFLLVYETLYCDRSMQTNLIFIHGIQYTLRPWVFTSCARRKLLECMIDI